LPKYLSERECNYGAKESWKFFPKRGPPKFTPFCSSLKVYFLHHSSIFERHEEISIREETWEAEELAGSRIVKNG